MKGLFLIVFAAIVVYGSAQGTDLGIVCPTPVFEDISYAPHPCNCFVYFECNNGIKYAKKCDPPLMFNPTLQICDWPSRTKCEINPACPEENKQFYTI